MKGPGTISGCGRPSEAAHASQRPPMYLGGLVTFCRYAGCGFHEVGVSLKAAQSQPIFSTGPVAAMESLDWLRADAKTL